MKLTEIAGHHINLEAILSISKPFISEARGEDHDFYDCVSVKIHFSGFPKGVKYNFDKESDAINFIEAVNKSIEAWNTDVLVSEIKAGLGRRGAHRSGPPDITDFADDLDWIDAMDEWENG